MGLITVCSHFSQTIKCLWKSNGLRAKQNNIYLQQKPHLWRGHLSFAAILNRLSILRTWLGFILFTHMAWGSKYLKQPQTKLSFCISDTMYPHNIGIFAQHLIFTYPVSWQSYKVLSDSCGLQCQKKMCAHCSNLFMTRIYSSPLECLANTMTQSQQLIMVSLMKKVVHLHCQKLSMRARLNYNHQSSK